MKKLFLLLIPALFSFSGCHPTNATATDRANIVNTVSGMDDQSASPLVNPPYSQSIPIDTANRMIMSYLNGINYTVNTKEIRSWTFDADTLRAYLNNGDGGEITTIRLILAHSLAYIHAGHEGQRPPVNSHVLRLIIVGINENNNYIYNLQGAPYEYTLPCPSNCADAGPGTAASDTLVHDS